MDRILNYLNRFLNTIADNKLYYVYILLILIIPVLFPSINNKWIIVGLAFSSALINNSFQIFGTFIVANKNKSFITTGLFLSSIFFATTIFTWFFFNKELHFNKLNNIPYQENLNIFQYIAPLLLMFLTKKKIPVSATFLFLSLFASKSVLNEILNKTIQSYIISFIISFIIFKYVSKILKYFLKDKINFEELKQNDHLWFTLQYVSTSLLLISWLMSNNSTILVFVDRKVSVNELLLFLFFGCFTIFYLMYKKGGSMQNMIKNKKNINDVYSATIINIIFSFLIYFFQLAISMPISTTWVFIGLMGGRELAVIEDTQNVISSITYRNSITKILKDLLITSIGIVISFLFLQFTMLF